MDSPALLALEDGTLFRGRSVGTPGRAVGEVVFNTAMTGYQEILTDPSYCRQIVTLTHPHIGNTGVNRADDESVRVYASGLVVRDLPGVLSNWRAEGSLEAFLSRHGVVAIADVDTRRLTRLLREKGAQNGCILAGGAIDEAARTEAAIEAARAFPGLAGMDLADEVSTLGPYEWREGGWEFDPQPGDARSGDTDAGDGRGGGFRRYPDDALSRHVVAYDFGIKRNILRTLASRGCRVTVVPARWSAEQTLALEPDGVFLSNGPGDPEPCGYAITATRVLLEAGVPVFGICLGLQLLGLAAGGRTVKMKFGHHGANHPVVDVDTGRVLITSQNHGFAVDEQSLPGNVRTTHRSLFDGSLQGIHLTDRPAFGFQGHPEASPGPHDATYLFDHFVALMSGARDESGRPTPAGRVS